MHKGSTRQAHHAFCVDQCVHELFAGHALAAPDRVAVSCAGVDLTYGELDALAERLAGRLRGVGVAGNAPVGVLLERSAEFVVAVLAVLKAGGCYVPLDPGYPPARLSAMAGQADVRSVIVRGEPPQWLAAHDAPAVDVDADAGVAGDAGGRIGGGAEDAPAVVRTDDLACIMFTSGSTGTPKGVAVRHAGIVRLVDEPHYVHLDADQVIAHLSSVSFDAATFEIWGALVNGARLVVAPPGRLTPQETGALLRQEGVTCAWLTAGLFNVMVDECPEAFTGLRQLLTGGDVMSPDHARRFLEAAPRCTLVNGYGPTEVTTFTACHTVTKDDTRATRIPIGRPIDGTRTVILDDDLRPVPPGVPGHLHVGGLGVARGYVGDPALTAERFVPDPWSHGRRLYATGDLAVLRRDGTLDFLGRVDRQLKKRGFRVEPAEVEAVLREDPLVADAVLVLHGERADDAVLVACLVLHADAADAEDAEEGTVAGTRADAGAGERTQDGRLDAVRGRLAGRLPEHLLPDRMAAVDAFPLTPNGKVDRRALAAAVGPAAPARVGAAPRAGAEQDLAAIWTEILGLSDVARDDDFFALGGQSLQASRMASRIRSRLGVSLPLDAVFDNPTIAELARLLEAE